MEYIDWKYIVPHAVASLQLMTFPKKQKVAFR